MFADTGIPCLFESMYRYGCSQSRLVVKVAGGGELIGARGTIEIGRRNFEAVGRLLETAQFSIAATDVGGKKSRTAKLHVGSGRVTISSQGEEVEL